jgi:hypothetical protein
MPPRVARRDLGLACAGGAQQQRDTAVGCLPQRLVQLKISKNVAAPAPGSDDGVAPAGGTAVVRRELSIRPADGGTKFVLTVSEFAADGGESTRTTALRAADAIMIKHLLTQSLTWLTGWAQNLDPSTFQPAHHLLAGAAEGGSTGAGFGSPGGA